MNEHEHLNNARKRQQLLRDLVTGVASGLYTGLLVYGRGGIGKSFIVDDQLQRLGRSHQKVNSHITPLALYEELERYRNEIIVLEDCESILKSPVALGILRSATFPSEKDRNGNSIRRVDYHQKKEFRSFHFNGRIIMLMNRGLGSTPDAEALESRIETIEYDLSNAEVAAIMRSSATEGYTIGDNQLSAEECQKVVEFLIQEARKCGRQLNLRLMDRAYKSYLLSDNLDSGCSWQDLVTSMVQGQPSVLDSISPARARESEKEKELDFARSICELDPAERLNRWIEETEKSSATMYRRIKEVATLDSQMFGV